MEGDLNGGHYSCQEDLLLMEMIRGMEDLPGCTWRGHGLARGGRQADEIMTLMVI